MAKASGLSTSTVQRLWRAFGLQPHRAETFKLSADPDFVAKVRDIVGLVQGLPLHPGQACGLGAGHAFKRVSNGQEPHGGPAIPPMRRPSAQL
jgi:hypothetical protein